LLFFEFKYLNFPFFFFFLLRFLSLLQINGIAWSSDGSLIVASSENLVTIHTLDNLDVIYTDNSTIDVVSSCSFFPGDDTIVLLGIYQQISLWCFDKGTKTQLPNAHQKAVQSIAVSCKAKRIATTSNDYVAANFFF